LTKIRLIFNAIAYDIMGCCPSREKDPYYSEKDTRDYRRARNSVKKGFRVAYDKNGNLRVERERCRYYHNGYVIHRLGFIEEESPSRPTK
jgi:hypothetical protein